jgi:hypothetical protein
MTTTLYVLGALGLLTLGWVGLIYFGGTARFGRAQTQAWIDAIAAHPLGRPFGLLLNAMHGGLRASTHYIEFAGLCLLMVGVATLGTFRIGDYLPWAFLAFGITCMVAWLDELHQSRTPGRQFRRIDFMHSLAGASLMFIVLLLIDLYRIPAP